MIYRKYRYLVIHTSKIYLSGIAAFVTFLLSAPRPLECPERRALGILYSDIWSLLLILGSLRALPTPGAVNEAPGRAQGWAGCQGTDLQGGEGAGGGASHQ